MLGRAWTTCGLAACGLSMISALVPVAVADPPPPCADVTDSALVSESGFYVIGSEVWLEHNGVAGLQRQSCTRDDDTIAPPDTFVTTLGAAPSDPGDPPP